MNKVYVDDIISIVKFIVKNDPYDVKHQECNWQFRKLTASDFTVQDNFKAQHIWRVESNTDADAIIEGSMIDDKTKPETELNKVLLLVLELC